MYYRITTLAKALAIGLFSTRTRATGTKEGSSGEERKTVILQLAVDF